MTMRSSHRFIFLILFTTSFHLSIDGIIIGKIQSNFRWPECSRIVIFNNDTLCERNKAENVGEPTGSCK